MNGQFFLHLCCLTTILVSFGLIYAMIRLAVKNNFRNINTQSYDNDIYHHK